MHGTGLVRNHMHFFIKSQIGSIFRVPGIKDLINNCYPHSFSCNSLFMEGLHAQSRRLALLQNQLRRKLLLKLLEKNSFFIISDVGYTSRKTVFLCLFHLTAVIPADIGKILLQLYVSVFIVFHHIRRGFRLTGDPGPILGQAVRKGWRLLSVGALRIFCAAAGGAQRQYTNQAGYFHKSFHVFPPISLIL